ncbi:hypothetical protein NQ318_022857 [Aromia moschata]|uniref:MADF domain-containing protein n=1 Tax=Aromia moschata TaxID=1265417 RepID=A0AAV8Y4Q1_9CUCU|nr:hypothetical protein NQ318_022857 [Aromia moschata]
MVEKQKTKEREFIVDCIHLYRELPALWNIKSKEYHDRDKKNTAYETLLEKYKEMFPDATKDDLKKKFNSLRANYLKEFKKTPPVNEIRVCCRRYTYIKSSLRYYREMAFLEAHECAADSQSTMDKSQSVQCYRIAGFHNY